MEALLKDAPAGWQKMSLEAVIEAPINNGTPGPPRVMAKHFLEIIWITSGVTQVPRIPARLTVETDASAKSSIACRSPTTYTRVAKPGRTFR